MEKLKIYRLGELMVVGITGYCHYCLYLAGNMANRGSGGLKLARI